MEQTDKTRSALFAAVVTTVVVLALSLLVGGLPTWLWAVILILADGMAVLIARGVVDRREQALLRKIMEQQRGQIEETVVDPEPDEPTHVQYPISAIPSPAPNSTTACCSRPPSAGARSARPPGPRTPARSTWRSAGSSPGPVS
ncbi:hypothetical protein GCM10029964_048470 [Kibdelosporangium lantanae]